MPKFTANLKRVEEAFDQEMLTRICLLPEDTFGDVFGLDRTRLDVPGLYDEDYYFFKDNDASVLFVAHLDTVVSADKRRVDYAMTADGLVIHSGCLDDRLGAFVGLSMLPKLGIKTDVLLTVGEESGASTAEFFDAPHGKVYDHIIEFDRKGVDVVLYEYEDDDLIARVRKTGAHVAQGIFSDISYMEHLGTKAMNWGVGYHDYHSVRGYAYLDDTFEMVARYMKFHQQNVGIHLPHTASAPSWMGKGRGSNYSWDDYLGSRPEPGDPAYVEGYFDDDGYWHSEPESETIAQYGSRTGDIYIDDDGQPFDVETHRDVYDLGNGRYAYIDDRGRYVEGARASADPFALPDEYEGEPEYFDRDYNEDPTMEEIQSILEQMDEEDMRRTDRAG
jgi:hypothetical protein